MSQLDTLNFLKQQNIITSDNKISRKYRSILNKNHEIKQHIINSTSFLDDNVSIKQRLYTIIYNINSLPICARIGCNNKCVFFNDGRWYNQYSKFCSSKCGTLDESHTKNIKRTKQIKYGDPFYNNRKKALITHCNRNLNTSISNLEKLQDDKWLKDQNYYHNKSLAAIADDLSVSKTAVQSRFKQFNIPVKCFPSSIEETQLETFIKTLPISFKFKTNDKTIINPYELDIIFPEKKIAIELNGLYWHSETHGRLKKYHLQKLNMCKDMGYTLLQFNDNQWNEQGEVVKSIIKYKLGCIKNTYNARECIIKLIDQDMSDDFLNNNHMQKSCKAKVKLGLFKGKELLGCMTFSQPRYNRKIEWELIRYACKCDTIVRGGASKLFKYFIRNYDPTSIISYSDKQRSDGDIYKTLGFKYSHTSQPGYVYFKYKNILSRNQCQKHKLHKLLDNFDERLSEYDNMVNNGFHRVWNCGNDVWIWQ